MGTVWECLFYRREKVNLYFLKVICFCLLLLDILHECCVVLNRMNNTPSSASHPEVHSSTGFTPDVKKWRKDRDGIVPIKEGEGLEEFSAAEQKAIADVIQVVEAIPQENQTATTTTITPTTTTLYPLYPYGDRRYTSGSDIGAAFATFLGGLIVGGIAIPLFVTAGLLYGLYRARGIGFSALKNGLSGIGFVLSNLGGAGLHLADKLRQLSNRLSSENDAINYNENASTVLPPELEDSHMAFAGAYMGVAVGTAFHWVLHNRAKILIGLVVFGSLVLMAAGIYLYNRSYDQYAEAEKDMKLGVVREDTREAREKMEAMRGDEPAPTVKYVALSPPNLIGEWAPPPAPAPAPAPA